MESLTGINAALALADNLIRVDRGAWPKKAEAPILTKVNTWAAMRDGDRESLITIAARGQKRDARRTYRVDPLADRIADAWAHYLFGTDPVITAPAAGDVDNYARITPRRFASDLEGAGALAVSEGEAWARSYVDTAVSDVPLLEWISRANIYPLWVGRRLAAAAIITELPCKNGTRSIYRHAEIHAVGVVINVLFRGKDGNVGDVVPLTDHYVTANLAEIWQHNLPLMLLERVPNRIRRNPLIGVSDYDGILDFLLDINEAAAIGSTNMRLTARKRAVISAAAARGTTSDLDLTPEENGLGTPARPQFDADETVLIEDPIDRELGGGGTSSPFRVLEYTFDAEPLIAWRRELVDTALSRVGLTAQYVGVGEAAGVGYAISGTALRLRLIPTDSTGRGKGRYWDDALPRIIRSLGALDNLSVDAGGFGRAWSDLTTLPTVERRPGLPVDEVEDAQRHATLVNNGLESIATGVAALHPDWTPDRVDAEVALIRADRSATMPTFG